MQSELLENASIDKNKRALHKLRSKAGLPCPVWAMDERKDELADLKDRMLDYADDTLLIAEIPYSFDSNIVKMGLMIKPNVRQAAYLIFKESITNIVKHSDTKEVEIRLDRYNDLLHLSIRDRGSQEDKTNISGLRMSYMRARGLELRGFQLLLYERL
ncbi:MAG: signal transduction histidine kinase [Saprospiraceae bacterium]|jgi:signal transduction histidine kinase